MSTTAPSLRQLQRWFASVSTRPDLVGYADGRAAHLERLLTRGPQLSASERLRIYQEGYLARLHECLLDDYPALCHALGDAEFAALTRCYVDAHPSRSPSLNGYGRNMAGFCRSRPEPWAQFAAAVAELEWALVEVIHEPSAAPLSAEALAKLPPARLNEARLVATPALRLLRNDYPVSDYYQSFCEEASPSVPARAPSSVVVYREGLTLWRKTLEADAASLLQDLLRGAPLELAIRALENRYADPAAKLALAPLLSAWLADWLECGFFTGIELGS